MSHQTLGDFLFAADHGPDGKPPNWLFTENESNPRYLHDHSLAGRYYKDAFHDYIVGRKKEAVNPEQRGTKAAAAYKVVLKAGEETVLKLRLWSATEPAGQLFGTAFDQVIADRLREANEFYDHRIPVELDPERRNVMRQSYGGLMWNKQFYHYAVYDWLKGMPICLLCPKPESRFEMATGRICSIGTSSRCRTSGSIPGTRHGIWRSIWFRLQMWIITLRGNN